MMTILRAIVDAVKSIGRVAGAALLTPFRMLGFGGRGGGGKVPIEAVPEVAPPAVMDPSTTPDRTAMYKELADICITWAAMSIVDDRPGHVPPKLPSAIKEWLPGLTRDQCEALISASPGDVEAHLRGEFPLAGVPKVQRLTSLRDWPAPARKVHADADIFTPTAWPSLAAPRCLA